MIALLFLLRAANNRVFRVQLLAGAAAFALFGVSDILEAHTGAWWRPWWLLMMKGTCLAVFAWLMIFFIRQRKRIV